MCKNSNGRKPTIEYLSLYLPFTKKYFKSYCLEEQIYFLKIYLLKMIHLPFCSLTSFLKV